MCRLTGKCAGIQNVSASINKRKYSDFLMHVLYVELDDSHEKEREKLNAVRIV